MGWTHLLRSCQNVGVLEIVGCVLGQAEVENSSGEEEDEAWLGQRQD